MNKKEIWNKYFELGEFSRTDFVNEKAIFLAHSQKNEGVLIQSCKTFNDLVQFDLDCLDYVWDERTKRYSNFPEMEYVNMNKWKMVLYAYGEEIYPDTDLSTINYPNIEKMINLHWKVYDMAYTEIIDRLLKGEV